MFNPWLHNSVVQALNCELLFSDNPQLHLPLFMKNKIQDLCKFAIWFIIVVGVTITVDLETPF